MHQYLCENCNELTPVVKFCRNTGWFYSVCLKCGVANPIEPISSESFAAQFGISIQKNTPEKFLIPLIPSPIEQYQ